MLSVLRTILSGVLMGTADLVPGVSGGTIALVLGIYERLVASIRNGGRAIGSFLRADFGTARSHLTQVEWGFIVPLLGGILTAVAVLAGFLDTQLERRPEQLAGLFLGLVVGSVVIAWRLIRRPGGRHAAVAAVVAVTLFALLGGEGAAAAGPSLAAFFGAGALAICAMILPGISGSLILLLLGMYAPVLDSVTALDLATLGALVAGAVTGLALFSQVLHWALVRHHDVVVAGLVGLMAGSLRVLWPWPEGVESAVLGRPEGGWPWVLLAAALGLGAVFLIAMLAEEPQPRLSEARASSE